MEYKGVRFKDIFFAKEGKYKASGVFSFGHFFLVSLTIISLIFFIIESKDISIEKTRIIIRAISIELIILEIIKIIFKTKIEESTSKYDSWIPLYFCSITIYASIASGFLSENIQRMGDVFLAVGGLIGGLCFLIYPSSSLLIYPWKHFLCFHSFFYHGSMVYLGLLTNMKIIKELTSYDFLLYAGYVLFFSILAIFINKKKGTNLMFISYPMPNSFIEKLGNVVGKLYPLFVIFMQIIPTFYLIKYIRILFYI